MSCNLLLVEDDPLSRRNLMMFLQQSGHNVHQTNTGEAALDLIARINFDVVISDLRLPGNINGLDVLRHHSKTLPGKRLVLVTAFGSDDVRVAAEELGAFYMEKPISLNALLARVDRP